LYERIRYFELIEKIYDATDTPACWTDFQEQFADLYHGEGCVLYLHDLSSCRSLFGHSTLSFVRHTRFDLKYAATAPYFNDNGLNVWLETSKNIPEGVVFTTNQTISDTDLHKSAFYNDWLKPQGLAYGLGGVVLRQNDISVRLGVTRTKQQGPFTTSDVESFRQLMPHLQRACRLYIKRAEAEALRNCTLESLGALPMGLILLNQHGRALFCNLAAEMIIERNDGFGLDANSRCCSSVAAETIALQKLIMDSIDACLGKGLCTVSSMKLTRPGFVHPLYLQISPLPSQSLAFDQMPCAVLLIYDFDSNTKLSTELLTSLYGLSLGEAQVATSLAMGATLDLIASEHHRSIHTVRTQLKQVFRKTNTRSQTDLVRLVLSGPAGFCKL